MITLHKLHAGDGYTYLTRQVAAGDGHQRAGQALVDYYTATGNPPGRWVGAGAADLAVVGTVREDQMKALFGRGMHPDADAIIDLELTNGATPEAALTAAKLGRAFPTYEPLESRPVRIATRVADFEKHTGRPPTEGERLQIEKAEGRRERQPVAGYDLVFTPVKTASLLWALGGAAIREQVEAAHHDAVTNVLTWLEQETAYARTGAGGAAQVRTRGFIGAAFDHRDSRAGDPDLHTHLAISNKVRAVDDRPDGFPHWLSLDARIIHSAGVAASERYNTRFEDALVRRLGVEFVERADSIRADKRVIREVAGVPDTLIKHFSRRRALIEDRYTELLGTYRHDHGHQPSNAAELKLAQQATLETRKVKGTETPLAEKISAWRDEAAAVIGGRKLASLAGDCTNRTPQPSPTPGQIDLLVAEALSVLSGSKATWTRWNLTAELERQLRPLRFTTGADRELVTQCALDRLLQDEEGVVTLTCDTYQGSGRFTTQATLAAEQRLLDAADQETRYALDLEAVIGILDSERGPSTLDEGQRALVTSFATDPHRVVVGIGPAGAGKTTAMRAFAQICDASSRRIVPLAPSAAAAAILSDELECRAENLHKFQHTHETADPTTMDDWYRLQPGDIVLVDEAGMAATNRLDWLTTYARERGALVRLLGDPYQLSSVEAGGAFGLLVRTRPAAELTELHRFDDPAEAQATLKVRAGDTTAIEFYQRNNRINSGATDEMLARAFTAWNDDLDTGHTSMLIASSNNDVTALNTRARRERINAGLVEPTGVLLHDGTMAGVGDHILTRINDRSIRTDESGEFVRNGDTWTITLRHLDGDLTVTNRRHQGTVRLPRDYVEQHVQLGYATTAARAQGATVHTTHIVVDERMNRETLYVAATRGRRRNHLYAISDHQLDHAAERPPAPTTDVTHLLEGVIRSTGNEPSATELLNEDVQGRPMKPRVKLPEAASRRRSASRVRSRHALLSDSAAANRNSGAIRRP